VMTWSSHWLFSSISLAKDWHRLPSSIAVGHLWGSWALSLHSQIFHQNLLCWPTNLLNIY
jgi:hypothetical protein